MKIHIAPQHQNHLLFKLATSIVAGLVVSALLLMIGNGGGISWFPAAAVFASVAACLLSALAFPFIWHALEKRQRIDSQRVSGVLNTVICYGIAANIASFGWKKVFGLQFLVPDEIASRPMNEQTGEWLTWYYFGYSQTFGLLIAFVQVAGACLLLFRRTLLLGCVLLLALMLNLTLVNICYAMNAGAVLQSVVLTIGLLFLVLQDYKRIRAFFADFPSGISMPDLAKPWLCWALRLLVVLLPMLFTIYLKALLPA